MAVAGIPAVASALGSMGLSSGAAAAGSSILTNAALGAAMNKLKGGSAFQGAAMGGLSSALGGSPGWSGLLGTGPGTTPASPVPGLSTTPTGTGIASSKPGQSSVSGFIQPMETPEVQFNPGEMPPLPNALSPELEQILKMGLI